MEIHWKETKEEMPEHNRNVLLLVENKKGRYITEGYLTDQSERLAKTGHHSKERWREFGYGLTWFDYAHRQIQSYEAKKPSNNVVGWAYLD